MLEVADNTLNKDCNQKARAYAKAKIADYWVLDVNNRQIYVFREPGNTNYQRETILGEDATLSLLAFPEIEVEVKQLFP